jgi:hypothetical protein
VNLLGDNIDTIKRNTGTLIDGGMETGQIDIDSLKM